MTAQPAEAAPRPADEVLDPRDLGGARYTRHSFARALVRRAAADGWRVARESAELDDEARGTVVYRVDAGEYVWRFVAFSQKLTDDQRTDRVIADAWDVTGALVEGELDDDRIARLHAQVTRQEAGRADAGTIIWTRANRSERFFDYVAGCLADGHQPDPEVLGSAPYILRSTAFYSNGKFGLADFERFGPEHPLGVPYRAHMLTAWLLRELAYDMVEHCAGVRGERAARLRGAWRRHLGLGNATGLGMVPYVINHPAVLDAWVRLREQPLAWVLERRVRPGDPGVARLLELIDRAVAYLDEQRDLATAPFATSAEIARQVAGLRPVAAEFAERGTIGGVPTDLPWMLLHARASAIGPECRGVLASLLTELSDPARDAEVESWLRVRDDARVDAAMSCGRLAEQLAEGFAWCACFDADRAEDQHHFWFSSENNEEPRRALRSADPGADVEHCIDIARQVVALRAELDETPPATPVAVLLARRPWHRQAVARVQAAGRLAYAEVRDNLLARDFLPLNLQRFQLAVYGMENYSPQSTDWLRVTLFSGAPRAAELAEGTADDDWIFTLRPTRAR